MVQERLIGFGTANIKVFGVGGGGGNAINRMYKDTIPGIEFVAVNTDNQALENSLIPEKIRIGDRIARGMGVGGDPSRGKQSAEESRSDIKEYLNNADMVFVAAGMGGGSGTGAAPVIAEIAKSSGALTIGVVTKPFGFEGTQRLDAALEGIENLKKYVDTLIVVPNDRLLQTEENLSMNDAFALADDVLKVGIQSIAELILVPGEINLDFADVKTIMENAGPAWMGIGESSGEGRAIDAAEKAVSSPLLELPIDGAKGVIFADKEMSAKNYKVNAASFFDFQDLMKTLIGHMKLIGLPEPAAHKPGEFTEVAKFIAKVCGDLLQNMICNI